MNRTSISLTAKIVLFLFLLNTFTSMGVFAEEEVVYTVPQSQMSAFIPPEYPTNQGGNWFAPNGGNVIDGDRSTYIVAHPATSAMNPYVILDLGDTYPVYQVRYQARAATGGVTQQIQNYAVYICAEPAEDMGSIPEDKWVLVKKDKFQNHWTDLNDWVAEFEPVLARYVKFQCMDVGEGLYKSISELNVAYINKAPLAEAIAQAQDILDSAEIGTEPGQYPQQAVSELSSAIAAASRVYNNVKTSQSDINVAKNELENAVQVFLSKANITDEEAVFEDKQAIDLGSLARVVKNITLPVKGANNCTITWSSSNPSVISNSGVVVRPAWYEEDAIVTLTATVSRGSVSETRSFTAKVPSKGIEYKGTRYSLKEIITEDYESTTQGTVLERYEFWNVVADLDPDDPSNKVARVVYTETPNVTITDPYTFNMSKGIMVFETRVKLSDEAQTLRYLFFTSEDEVVFTLPIDELATVGEWSRIKVIIDMKNEKYDLYVDENKVADQEYLHNYESIDYTGMGISGLAPVYGGGAEGQEALYVDDVMFYEVVDKRALEALIDEARRFISSMVVGNSSGQYTKEAKSRLESAVSQAQNALESIEIGQTEIDYALAALQKTIDSTEPIKKSAAPAANTPVYRNVNTTVQPLPSKQDDSTVTPVGGAAFRDIENHWAREYIEQMVEKSIVVGIDDDTFAPDVSISRAEFITLVCRVLKLEMPEYKNIFTDISSGDWFAKYVQAMADAGIISTDNEAFRPNDQITREEMTKVIVLAGKFPVSDGEEGLEVTRFSDRSDISDWAVAYVEKALQLGLVLGVSDDTFAPKAPTTRAQAVVVIKRLFDGIVE